MVFLSEPPFERKDSAESRRNGEDAPRRRAPAGVYTIRVCVHIYVRVSESEADGKTCGVGGKGRGERLGKLMPRYRRRHYVENARKVTNPWHESVLEAFARYVVVTLFPLAS